MNNKKLLIDKEDNMIMDKEVFVIGNDEEVLNCEGSPCNFVYKNDIER